MNTPLLQLLNECTRGKLKAQQSFFERYRNKVFTICLRYARDRPEAEDMLQDAFITLFRDLKQFTGQGNFDGWLHRVTVRVALQHLRKRNPLRFAEDFSALPVESSVVLPDSELTRDAILKCVQQLPVGYRTIFNMHCVEAWSYPEIAEELGISESSVRSQYSRACKQLRDMVNQLFLYAL